MCMEPKELQMCFTDQATIDAAVQVIEDAIVEIGQIENPRKAGNKILRMLERIKVLREFDYITAAQANQLAHRVKQAKMKKPLQVGKPSQRHKN